jgi:cytochrome c
MKGRFASLAVMLSVGAAAGGLVPQAWAETHEDGAALFQTRCAACHGLDPAAGKMGPPLRGVIGRRAASIEGYAYSRALRSSGLVWSPRTLDAFLASPNRVAPGSTMPVSVTDPATRAALVKYLAAQTPRRRSSRR